MKAQCGNCVGGTELQELHVEGHVELVILRQTGETGAGEDSSSSSDTTDARVAGA